MANNLKEPSKSSDNSSPLVKIPWTFNKTELILHTDMLKNFISIPESADLEGIQVIMSSVNMFIQKVLLNSYTRQESERIIDFLSQTIENSLAWGRALSLSLFSEPILQEILGIFCELMQSLFGLDQYTSVFHNANRKTALKKYKAWDGSTFNGNASKISLYFINLFGKHGGFEFILKIMISDANLEFIYDIGTFSLVKYVNKGFESWIMRFKNLLPNKIMLLTDRKSQSFDYYKLFCICVNADKFNTQKTAEERFDMMFISALVKSYDKTFKIKALEELNKIIATGLNIIQWVSSQQIIEHIFETHDPDLIAYSEEILKVISPYISFEQIELIYYEIESPLVGYMIENLLCKICRNLTLPTIQHIFSLFSYESNGEISFALKFSMTVLESFDFALEAYPLSYFKELLDDKYVGLHSFAINALSTIYSHFALNPRIDEEISQYIKEIKHDVRTVQNIKLILNMHKNSIRFKYLLNESAVGKVVENILKIQNNDVYPERQKIKSMLDFIELYIRINKNIEKCHFNMLCQAFAYNKNEDIFSDWFEKSIVCLPPDLTLVVFKEYFSQTNGYDRLTIHTFKCFSKMFLVINSYERCIELKQGLFQVRLQQNLKYLETLIDIALLADENIFRECSQLLVSLNTRLADGIIRTQKQIWEHFFKIIISMANCSNKDRVLNIILNFLQTPSIKKKVMPVFFIYKQKGEKDYNKLYIEETAIIRDLKRKIGEKYGKSTDSIILKASGVKYDRFNDDLEIKDIKSRDLSVELDETKLDCPGIKEYRMENSGIKEYLSESLLVQNFLLRSLSDNERYSAVSLKILELIPINESNSKILRELSIPVEEIVGTSYYTFFYYSKIIKYLIEEPQWFANFVRVGGVNHIIEQYCVLHSEDQVFNQTMIIIAEKLVKILPIELNESLVRRIFCSICCLANLKCNSRSKCLYPKIRSLMDCLANTGLEKVENVVAEKELYKKIVINSLVVCNNQKFSEEMCTNLYQLCQKSLNILEMTLECIFDVLHTTEKVSFCMLSFFELTTLLLEQTNTKKYTEFIQDTFFEMQQEFIPIFLEGMILCLQGVVQSIDRDFFMFFLNKFVFYREKCGNYIAVRGKICGLFCKISAQRKDLFEIISENCYQVYACKDWQGTAILDWNYSPQYINTNIFSNLKLRKNSDIEFLSVILYQLYSISMFRKQILELMQLPRDNVLYFIQKIFSKLDRSISGSVNTSKLSNFILTTDSSSKPTSTNLNKFFKTFIKLIASSFSNLPYETSLIFQAKHITEYIGKKSCRHSKTIEIEINYLKIQLNYRSISQSLKNLFKIKQSDVEVPYKCNICNKEVVATKKSKHKELPKILILVIPRFEEKPDKLIKNDSYCEFPTKLDIKKPVNISQLSILVPYNLIGIIAHDRSSNDMRCSSYSKLNENWIEFTGNTGEFVRNPEFFKEFYGVSCLEDIKTATKTACVLIYEKCIEQDKEACVDLYLKLPLLEGLSDFNMNFRIEFLMSEEFISFVDKITAEKVLESLIFMFRYFFFIVIRLNDRETIVKFVNSLLSHIKNDAKNSEMLLDMLKTQEVWQDVLLNCPDKFKSRIIVEISHIAIMNSRPSAYLRLLSLYLQQLSSISSYQSESFFEIIYIICKINPVLAIEEGSIQYLTDFFSDILSKNELNPQDRSDSSIKPLKIPTYAVSSLSIFINNLNENQKSLLLNQNLIKLILSSNHNKLTALNTGKLYFELFKSSSFYLDSLLALLKKSTNLTQKILLMNLSGYMQCSKDQIQLKFCVASLRALFNEEYCSIITAHNIIDCLFLSSINSENFLSYIREEKPFLNLIEQFLSSKSSQVLRANPWILEFDNKSKQNILKIIKSRSLSEARSLNKLSTNPLSYTDERACENNLKLKLNDSNFYSYNEKLKIFNFTTGEII